MKRGALVLVAFLCVQMSHAAGVNMRDERRAVGTDEGIRIDAQLTTDSVTPHVPIGVTYQVHNLTPRTIGIVEKRCEASYDAETNTITLTIGAEIPAGGLMPHLATIKPGATRLFGAGASFSGPAVPRFVQVRVNVLRDTRDFEPIAEHGKLTDTQFDRWIDTNQAIDLNSIPVRYQPMVLPHTADASQR